MTKTTMIPDSAGAVTLKGYETEARLLTLKDELAKLLKDEVDALKSTFRELASEAIDKGRETGSEVHQILFPDGGHGSVGVTVPDYSKATNRSQIEAADLVAVSNAGGIEDVTGFLEEDKTVTVLPSMSRELESGAVVLTGELATWFKVAYMDSGMVAASPQFAGKAKMGSSYLAEPKLKLRLRAEKILELRSLAASGNAGAKALLSCGLQSLQVRPQSK
jgi:hypothetical protein